MEVEENARYSYQKEEKSSILATKLEAYQHSTFDNLAPPDLDYTYLTVKLSPLYDTFREELLNQYDYRNDYTEFSYLYTAIDPTPWQAEEAYQMHYGSGEPMNEYLIFWEDAILEINYDWTPTLEQMTITAENLHSN
jgi:hypothetical protein